MPGLRCLIGTSPDNLVAIPVNSSQAHYVSSDLFEGKIAVYVKFDKPKNVYGGGSVSVSGSEKEKIRIEGESSSHEYFSRPERAGVTWSIQVQGRFLRPYKADDILFGNTFDRPLHLPWGSSAALKFMHFIDPTLEHDLYGRQPWALSPLISTMPYFRHRRISRNADLCTTYFPEKRSISDDTSQILSSEGVPLAASRSSKARRTRFSNPSNRQSVTFGPTDLITTDFCYGFLKFPDLLLSLPAGISFDLKKYWDGQPVRFVCCERHPRGFRHAKTFWIVQFEIDDGLTEREESLIDEDNY